MNKIKSILNRRKILILLFLSLFITSCFGESDEVKKAKAEIGISGYEKKEVVNTTNIDNNSDKNIVLNEGKIGKKIKISKISGDEILEFDDLVYDDFKKGSSKISGKTLGIIDKITINFSNEQSDSPDDFHTLSKFKKGDNNFIYNVSTRYKVLDYGLNKYIITAYYGDFKSVYQVLILLSKNDDKYLEDIDGNNEVFEKIKEDEGFTKELIGEEDNLVYTDLPKGGDFGNVVKLGENSFTYSDIKGLEINKEIFQDINCGKNEDTDKYFVTEFLGEKINSGYYWNTCRDIVKGKLISFYVTRLDGKNYIYEKNYLDTSNGFYGTYEIEKGELFSDDVLSFSEKLDKLNIKRKELKDNNSEYKKRLSVVDNLFKKIVK